MLNSFNTPAFQIACLRFLNTFVQTATTAKEQVQVQCEMEEAGLDILQLKRNIKVKPINPATDNLTVLHFRMELPTICLPKNWIFGAKLTLM